MQDKYNGSTLRLKVQSTDLGTEQYKAGPKPAAGMSRGQVLNPD